MATKDPDDDIATNDTTATKKDSDLSVLLDEAFEDFKKYDTPGKESESDVPGKNEQPNPDEPSCTQPNTHPILSEYIENEDFQKLAEEFTKALDGMPEQDLDALQNFGRMVLTENFASGDVNPSEMEESLSRAFDALKQNMKDVEGSFESDFDTGLLDSVKNMGLDDGEEGFFEMMQGFMKELLSKEVIYPSLKEMSIQYPSWLEENKTRLPENEYNRYQAQYDTILELCKSFEKDTEEETDEEKKARFENHLLLIQKMQKCGQPPSDLMNKVMKETEGACAVGAAPGADCVVM